VLKFILDRYKKLSEKTMRRCLFLFLFFFIGAVQADALKPATKIECKLIFSKIPCWKDYTVYVDMIDAVTQEAFQNFKLTDKELSTTIAYDCQKHGQINFRAHYAPNIWQGDEKKTYSSSKVWDITSELAALPETTAESKVTFTLKAIFPDNFSEVPSPTVCDENKPIPKVPTH
jgi:hypothetical protein